MEKIRISAVSYMNTIPLVYGITHSGMLDNYTLQRDVPSVCAKKLLCDEVDIGLVPVAVIPRLKHYRILSDYCIGAEQKVRTVCLFSRVPLDRVTAVHLDPHSLTSITLVKVLAKHLWKIQPEWNNVTMESVEQISSHESVVAIGDKTFELEKKYEYVYDFADEWRKLTGLPFVFACWVANKDIPDAFADSFNNAMKYGTQNIPAAIDEYLLTHKTHVDLTAYFKENISFPLNDRKKQGMERFLELIG